MKHLPVLVLFLSFAVGCTEDDAQPPLQAPVPVTGILQMVGGPVGGLADPVAGRVTFRFDNGAGDTLSASANADGTFELELNPGDYEVTGTSPSFSAGQGLCRADGLVSVKAGMKPIAVLCHRR
jgi:hypothetical protein